MRTWEPGPSKILLAELEHQFFQQQLQGIRKAGYEGLVVPTSTWGGNGVASLPALAAFGSVDAHAYGSRGFLGSNPHQRPYFLHWLAAAQVQGLPHFASEWSVPQPAHDRAAAPLMVAAMARLQGWDAPILYNYSQRPLAQDSGGDTFSIAWDPAYIATLQAAALAYRREDVSPAHHSVRYHPQGGTWQNETPESSLALRSIAEQHQIEISLDEEPALNWWKPEKSSNSFEFKALDEGRVRSDTQEIERSWEQNQWSLFTPRTVAASGTLENGLRLHQFFFQSPLRHATIAWTSLDAQPIPTADQVLLSIVGNAVLEGNGQKIWSAERCPARVEIPRKQAPQSLHAVFPNGDPGPAIPHQWENGILKFNLDGNIATHWYLIRNS